MNRDELRNYHQYLERYAEPEARELKGWLAAGGSLPGQRAIVSIPLCLELSQIEGCLDSLVAASELHPALVIFIVNNRASAPADLKIDNEKTLAFLRSRMTSRTLIGPNILAGPLSGRLFLLVADRVSAGQELPEDQGVGMARKVGCDLAAVIISETGANDTFIRNTDGDARVAKDFFAPIVKGPAAALYRFRHESKQDGVDAVLQYEQYLHYYVRGMQHAGSPYAFHTVGSTIACDATSYISCRGFPKRDAGEDFYLLNKLAKVGPVVELNREPITLVARDSDRVPFGTGAACRRIEGLVLSGGTYHVYHPDCFRLLKIWLASVSEAVNSRNADEAFIQFIKNAESSFPGLRGTALEEIDNALRLRAGLAEVLLKSPRTEVLNQHARIWFDGFRSMRFLNMARDLCFAEVPVSQVAAEFHGNDK